MRTLIIDDESLARNELYYLLNEISSFEIIDETENVKETLERLLCHTYDLVFLDINLMDENGIGLTHKIRKMKHPPYIIFATAYDAFAVKVFELDAVDYILKPFELERIEQTVQRAKRLLNAKQQVQTLSSPVHSPQSQTSTSSYSDNQDILPIEVDEHIYVINLDDVVAISVNNGISTITTLRKTYETTEPPNYYKKKLPKQLSIKIHRAMIINKQCIESVEHWFDYTYQVTMTTNVKFQVSRSFMKSFKQEIGPV